MNEKDIQGGGADRSRADLRVTFHDELMRTSDQSEPVVVVCQTHKSGLLSASRITPDPHPTTGPRLTKRLADILSKRISSSTRADPPSTPIVRVRPQEITHGSFVRDFLDPVDGSDMVERVDRGGETSV